MHGSEKHDRQCVQPILWLHGTVPSTMYQEEKTTPVGIVFQTVAFVCWWAVRRRKPFLFRPTWTFGIESRRSRKVQIDDGDVDKPKYFTVAVEEALSKGFRLCHRPKKDGQEPAEKDREPQAL